jgi:hypothetical protein
MILYLICDSSGSMMEGGKAFIMRTLVISIAQWVRLGYGEADLKLMGWASEMSHFPDWTSKDEFPPELLSGRGSSSAQALIQCLEDVQHGKFLILTDGFWGHDQARLVRRWKEGLPVDSLRFVKIGADAHPQIKGQDVFRAEDWLTAIDGWLEGGRA